MVGNPSTIKLKLKKEKKEGNLKFENSKEKKNFIEVIKPK